MRLLRFYEVLRDESGAPVKVPGYLQEAERTANPV
jgi:hypothetical protein